MSQNRQAGISCNILLQGVYVFYLELVTDMLHLVVYIIFFAIVFMNYGLPLHLVRFSHTGTCFHHVPTPRQTSVHITELSCLFWISTPEARVGCPLYIASRRTYA